MPKVYLNDIDRAQALAETADDTIRLIVATRCMKHGMTQRQICVRMGMSAPTFCKRMKEPCNMTLKELRRLATALSMTDTEIGRCVGALGKESRK